MSVNSKKCAIETKLQVNGVKIGEVILNGIKNAINALLGRDKDTGAPLDSLQSLVCTIETDLVLTRGILILLSSGLSIATKLVSTVENAERIDESIANFSLDSIMSVPIDKNQIEELSTITTQIHPTNRIMFLKE